MIGRPAKRGDVIAAMNKLVREGVITSFRTDLFDKDDRGAEPTVTVMVDNPSNPDPVLRRVREALVPLGLDLKVQLSTWQTKGRD